MKQQRKLPSKFLAAMIAVLPLPGSPMYGGDDRKIIKQAISDLKHYEKAGVDSVLLENDHDLPYIKPPLPSESILLMTRVAKEVRKRFNNPIGIQMLEAANVTSLEIAAKADLDYIRAEGYVFAHVGGSGIVEGSGGKILRRRKELGVEHIKVFGDVKKKHCSHSLTSDLDITDEIIQAEFFLVDGIVVTSKLTGVEPNKRDLVKAKKVTKLPIIIGSGMSPNNIKSYLPLADGFIVGTTFRKGNQFLGELEPDRLNKFMKIFLKERSKLQLR